MSLQHRLSNRDEDNQTADCSVCGPIDMRRSGGGWECGRQKGIRGKAWKKENPEKAQRHRKDRHARLKCEVFEAYGNKCVCCGESDLHFLTIDHVNGIVPDRHRQPDGRRLSGTAFLYKIRDEGYPDDCRILCWNCNCARAYYGFCPHQPHNPEDRRYV